VIKSNPNCINCFHLKVNPFIQTSTGEVYLNLTRETKTWCELDNWRKLKLQYVKEINIRHVGQIALRSLKKRSYTYETIADLCKDYDEEDI